MGKIIWLASYPKSGNTWTRAFLHNLLINPDKPIYINDLDTFCVGESGTGYYKLFLDTPREQWTEDDVARTRPQVHVKLTEASPDNVFVKTHCALTSDHGHPTVNLEVTAGAIYIVRNPLDVVLSAAHHNGLSINRSIRLMSKPNARSKTNDKHVHEFRGSWSQHVSSWTARPHPTLHVMRYEDMLATPRETFARLAKFLGLDPPEPRMQKAIAMSSFEVLKEQERRWGFREKTEHADAFFRAGTSEQWKDKLTRDQVAAMVNHHRQQMMRFGYVPPGF
jgi:uncharacterized protein (DUF924 family)